MTVTRNQIRISPLAAFLRLRENYRKAHDSDRRGANTFALAVLYSELDGERCERAFRLLNQSTARRSS